MKKLVGTGLLALSLMFSVGFIAPTAAQAASLTSAQVSAIISLLQSFGADQSVINNVSVSLGGGSSSSLSCSSFGDVSYGNFDNNPGGRVSQLQTWLGISSNTFGFGTYGRKTQAMWNARCGGTTPSTPTANTAPTAAFDSSSLTSSLSNPVITGSASNVGSVSIAIKGYNGGSASVVNGRWSITITDALPAGTYGLQLGNNDNNTVLTTATLTVNSNGSNTGPRSLSVSGVSGYQITAQYSNMPSAGVYVRNTSGTVVWTQQLGSGTGSTVITLPSSVPAGTYVLNAFGTDGTIYANSAQFTYAPTSATVDQTSVSASSNMFTLTGSASNSNSVFVALVKSDYSGAKDWHTIYTNHSYVAFTGDSVIPVSGNRWSATFSGVSSGTYTVLVYDNSANQSTQSLLGSGALSVSASNAFNYVAGGSGSSLTLGVGQSTSDSGVQITLTSIYYTNGTSGTPMANFQVDIKGFNSSYYSATIGGSMPNGGGLSDPAVSCGGIGITVSAISIPMNTATITINPVCKG